jgi:hypothetical protein
LETKRDNSGGKVSQKTLAKLSAFSFNGSTFSGDSSANTSGIQGEHDHSAGDPELKDKQSEVQSSMANVRTPLNVQRKTKGTSKNVGLLTVGEGCDTTNKSGRQAEFQSCEENNGLETNRLENGGNRPVSTDSKAQPNNPFFQLPDDSDEDIMDDSFFSAASKKRKCFQLSDDLDNKKIKQASDDNHAPRKGQIGKNGGIGNRLLEAEARERCQSPSILLHSQHSLTLSQEVGQGQVKEQGQGQTKLLPSIGGTPSHSQDKMSGGFFSSTPIPKSASENNNTPASCLSHSAKPNATDSNTCALKPTFNASGSGITDAVSTPVVTTDKRPASSGKTTPSWLLKLNFNSQNRSKPVSAASSSSSSSLFVGGSVCDDLDLDLDLDFDQPFKKQRKS